VRFGVTLPNAGVGDDPRVVIDLAVEAEDAGWDGVFIWDFPIGVPDYGEEVMKVHEAWVLLSGMAMRTERVFLGTMITPLAWRAPWYVAKQAATMQALSGGRFVLSVGLGAPPTNGTHFYEETDRRVRAQMLDEGLTILEGLWSGEPLTFEGRHYRARNEPQMLPEPSPRPKVWVVGAWNRDPKAWPLKKSFRRALRWDGILPHVFDGDKMVSGNESLADDIGAMVADIRSERSEPFDVVIESGSTNDKNTTADFIRPLADAGATWWLEPIWYSMYRHPSDPGPMRERIREGPPKIG
jgi:hypothetical protein